MHRLIAASLVLLVCGCHPQLHVHLVYRAADKAWSVGLGEPDGDEGGPECSSEDVRADLEGLLESLPGVRE